MNKSSLTPFKGNNDPRVPFLVISLELRRFVCSAINNHCLFGPAPKINGSIPTRVTKTLLCNYF